jgi:RNA polymerase sigma factor (sigma-70 family)
MKERPVVNSQINLDQRDLLVDVQEYLGALEQGMAPGRHLTDAWETFFLVYDGVLRRNAGEFVNSVEDKDGLVLDAWEQVILSLPGFKVSFDGAGFRTWLFKLVRSKATDRARNRVFHRAADIDCVLRAESEPAGWLENPVALFERQEDREMLGEALEELRRKVSEADFHLFKLRWINQLTVAEIMASLNFHGTEFTHHFHEVGLGSGKVDD